MNEQINKSTKNSKIILVIILATIFFVGGILAWQWQWIKIAKYSHIKAFPVLLTLHLSGEIMPLPEDNHVISLKEAMLFAIQHLENKGAKNIKICEADFLNIPFGAYFIYGKGNFSIGEKYYSTFYIGIFDGSWHEHQEAGKEFAFIARGEDDKSNVFWYPEPGPDFLEELDGTDYKFLDRKKLESLSDRFK